MKAAMLEGPQQLVIRDVPCPPIGRGDLRVKVAACGLCPSDVRLWQSGHSDLLTMPAVIGHEAVGVVTDVGDTGDEHQLGRRVFVDGYGGFAEYSVVTSAMRQRQHGPFLLPERGLPFDEAVFAEPLADCLYAVEHCAEPDDAHTALVSGCGQMGLQIIRLLTLRGVDVVAVDPRAERRDLARAFGAVAVLPPGSASRPHSADISVVACDAAEAVSECLDVLAPGGTCVLFSTLPPEPMPVDMNRVHKRRLRIVGARWVIGRREPRWNLYRTAISLLAGRTVDVRPLLDRRIGLADIEPAFADMSGGRVMKAILHPDGDLAPR
jgi:L-iditol 2-dehydrogenase